MKLQLGLFALAVVCCYHVALGAPVPLSINMVEERDSRPEDTVYLSPHNGVSKYDPSHAAQHGAHRKDPPHKRDESEASELQERTPAPFSTTDRRLQFSAGYHPDTDPSKSNHHKRDEEDDRNDLKVKREPLPFGLGTGFTHNGNAAFGQKHHPPKRDIDTQKEIAEVVAERSPPLGHRKGADDNTGPVAWDVPGGGGRRSSEESESVANLLAKREPEIGGVSFSGKARKGHSPAIKRDLENADIKKRDPSPFGLGRGRVHTGNEVFLDPGHHHPPRDKGDIAVEYEEMTKRDPTPWNTHYYGSYALSPKPKGGHHPWKNGKPTEGHHHPKVPLQ